jgi:hypothetical protein
MGLGLVACVNRGMVVYWYYGSVMREWNGELGIVGVGFGGDVCL